MALTRRLDRLFDAAPVPPFWVGLGVALVLFAASQAVDAWALGWHDWFWGAADDEPVWRDEGSFVLLLLSLFIGAALVMDRHERAGAVRDLRELRPQLALGETEFAALEQELRAGRVPLARRLGLLGLAIGASIPISLLVGASDDLLLHDVATGVVFTALVGGLITWGLAIRIHQDRVFARALDAMRKIDLLAVDRLVPFARRGLRRALGLAIGVSLITPAVFEVGRSLRVGPVLAFLAIAWGLAAFGFLSPVLGVRKVVRAEKRAAERAVRERIRKEEEALREGLGPGGRLADWIAYQQQIESVREWPFDTSTLARFALYLGIPLGSWMGGALVERWVNRFLD